ncbi:MAG: hypothetical protein RR335_05030 [Eubacterium sp.]
MAQILKTIAFICLGLSAVGIAISIYLWFKLDIYKVWCDLTGRTEQKALEEIQKEKIKMNVAVQHPLSVDYSDRASNEELEQIWSESRVLSRTDNIGYWTEEPTDQIASAQLKTESITENDQNERLTEITGTDVETEIISDDETELLAYIEPESEVLSDSITEKLPDLSEYLDSGYTMELEIVRAEEKEPDPDLSSQKFNLIEKKIQVETSSRII